MDPFLLGVLITGGLMALLVTLSFASKFLIEKKKKHHHTKAKRKTKRTKK